MYVLDCIYFQKWKLHIDVPLLDALCVKELLKKKNSTCG